MSYCTKCGSRIAEGDRFCSGCGTRLEGVGVVGEGAPVVSTEEPKVKAERGGIGGVAKWAIVSAVVGALSGIAAVPLGVIGINQQYDWARNAHWANQGVGMPPGATIAAAVLTTVSIIFISLAIALGIYALRSARKE